MPHLKIDLHIHSKYSEDGAGDIEEILDRAIEKNLDAIAITDHDTLEGSLKAQKIGKDKDIIVIPGQEVTTRDGHLLVLGINKLIEPHKEVEETLAEVKEFGGFSIAPHPFHRYRHGLGRKLKKNYRDIDAVEVYNSRYITGIANKRAKWFASRNDVPVVAGSDAHIPEVIGYGTTIVRAEEPEQSIFDSIRKKQTKVELKKTPISLFLKQAWSSVFGSIRRWIRNLSNR
ncbi:histidinol-phosphatase [archaeon SCG-AAA382B04]|nr:histidinol-phosphatase [archaeon SCG-AAA382B04]